ncbi:MAG TPA: imidazole glycerol phosphate synthase subunit HisH [Actinomycetota bacterium]|nr:imidazole glycerol phosphate synthase subunit HisH [Actinomycetota bacterium]
MIAIVDVGLGNVASVRNMLDRLGYAADCRGLPDGLTETDRYILPGVGAYDEGVRRLSETGWYDHLRSLPESTHVLGICLGMQLLGTSSEEGELDGLQRVPAHFERFNVAPLRVPHMGWNLVQPVNADPIFDPELPEWRYYFTHSFRAVCDDASVEIGRTRYNTDFTSAYRSGNTRGVQFHPEKSHRFGMSLLSRWAELPC